MGSTLKVGVQKDPRNDDMVRCRRLNIRERVLRFLLGETRRLTILVPGDGVKTLSIYEEGGFSGEC